MTALDEAKQRWRDQYRAERRAGPAEPDLRPIAEEVPDFLATIARLQAKAPHIDEPPAVATSLADRRVERRRARIRHALRLGADDKQALARVEPLALALDAPPVIAGHEGSSTASAAVVAFLASARAVTLLLRGPRGRGKTWAATWATGDRDGSLLISTREIRVAGGWDELHARAVRAPLLVVDELGDEGKEGGSSWASDQAGALLQQRHNDGRPTIVTTNLPLRMADVPAELAAKWKGRTIEDRYGDRLADRLLDAVEGMVVPVLGARSIREMGQR